MATGSPIDLVHAVLGTRTGMMWAVVRVRADSDLIVAASGDLPNLSRTAIERDRIRSQSGCI